MMSAELFGSSCNYIRLVSLLMGLILFIIAMVVRFKPPSKNKPYETDEVKTRATTFYLRNKKEQRDHLFWMLVICSVVIWYIGAFIPSSYLTDAVVQKSGGCQGTFEDSQYSDYNSNLLLPPIFFGTGLVLSFVGNITRGNRSRAVHLLSYFFLLLGTIAVILMFRYVELCSISAKCT